MSVHTRLRQHAADRRRKVEALVVSVALLAVVAVVAVPAPANAWTPWDRCPHGFACLFEHENGNGRMWKTRPNGFVLVLHRDDNIASSVWNRTNRQLILEDYRGGPRTYWRFYDVPRNISQTHWWWFNERASRVLFGPQWV